VIASPTRRRRVRLDPFLKVDDDAARIFALVDSADRKLQEAFVRMITRTRDASTLAELEVLINAGRLDDAVALGTAAYEQFADEWVQVYIKAGRDTAGFVGRELAVIATFDQVNTRAVSAMVENQLRLVREITQSQATTMRSVLVEGVRDGLNPREVARGFRESIGLTAKQEQYVRNFRRELESGNARALTRQLRDRRFDGQVRRAIAGESLDTATINKMVDRYRQRFIKFRSEVIGRTEGLRSVHEGVEEMYQQAINAGEIDPDSFVRVWNTARDDRVRDTHQSMHQQRQPIGQPFVSAVGNQIRFPGDPNAPPEETVQCRCVLSARFKGGS
jgi:hypothetical protein